MPSLTIRTDRVVDLNISSSRSLFYVLYTLGGFRRQTKPLELDVLTGPESVSQITWNAVDTLPVNVNERGQFTSFQMMDITVFEQSPFGDKHRGSARVKWCDLAKYVPLGSESSQSLHEYTTIALHGVNSNDGRTKLVVGFTVDCPVLQVGQVAGSASTATSNVSVTTHGSNEDDIGLGSCGRSGIKCEFPRPSNSQSSVSVCEEEQTKLSHHPIQPQPPKAEGKTTNLQNTPLVPLTDVAERCGLRPASGRSGPASKESIKADAGPSKKGQLHALELWQSRVTAQENCDKQPGPGVSASGNSAAIAENGRDDQLEKSPHTSVHNPSAPYAANFDPNDIALIPSSSPSASMPSTPDPSSENTSKPQDHSSSSPLPSMSEAEHPVTGTLMYVGPRFPHPLPATTDLLPHEYFALIDKERRDLAQQHRSETTTSAARQSFKGALSAIAAVACEGAEKLASVAERKVRGLLTTLDEYEYKEHFRGLPDALIACYGCTFMHGMDWVPGKMFITSKHLLFRSPLPPYSPVRFGIQLEQIVSIQHAVALGAAAMQVFTLERGFYQFIHFKDLSGEMMKAARNTAMGTAFDRAYLYLDRTWRSVTTVPNPSVEFLPLSTFVVESE